MLMPALSMAETWITMGFTEHSNKSKEYCEVNPGISHDWRYGTVRTFVGAHGNSYCQASLVVGAAWLPFTYWRVSGGVTAMVLTGYEERNLTPAGALALSYDEKKTGVDVAWVPGYLVHLRYRFAF